MRPEESRNGQKPHPGELALADLTDGELCTKRFQSRVVAREEHLHYPSL
ncbi:hypothetical protein THTE_0990 [Thermogutta terrifontis]|uniref:Uncharacterized protein n=1 Tax=Thermogutta terrifontis TaxID=1331910 RepID=A0A286RCA1_9BACT|nr:hypothetical protein THTE_0990 [Thermogutta terrifontis]